MSDEEAAEYLKLMHQRLGHHTLRIIRELYRSGAIFGPEISDKQFEDVQFFCRVCHRTRQMRKPSARRARKKPKAALRILEEVYVDLMPLKVRSIRVRGPRGNRKTGGNTHCVVYVDRKTHRLFLGFVREKTQLVEEVKSAVAHMEMCARDSVEFNGKDPIKVGKFVSDRESNLTSNEAVAALLDKLIMHVMAPMDAKNATGLIDNLCRRLRDVSRSLLDMANVPIHFNEISLVWAAVIINMLPVPGHVLHHSPMRQWEGKPQDFSQMFSWGADVYPHLPVGQREHKSKQDVLAPGGAGRYRWFGWA